MTLILSIILNNIEVNYACRDQHIDATFNTYDEAKNYVEYFKPHHNYEIIAFFKFKENGNK